MKGIVFTGLICLFLGAAVFFSVRKLWRDKKRGKTFCSGDCACCSGCGEKK